MKTRVKARSLAEACSSGYGLEGMQDWRATRLRLTLSRFTWLITEFQVMMT